MEGFQKPVSSNRKQEGGGPVPREPPAERCTTPGQVRRVSDTAEADRRDRRENDAVDQTGEEDAVAGLAAALSAERPPHAAVPGSAP
jgi:hypothetical protein